MVNKKITISPFAQNLFNWVALIVLSAVLWWIFKPIEVINEQTIINNKEFIIIGFVILTFFEFEFWAGIKRFLGKDPGKFVPGFVSSMVFFFLVIPQLGIMEYVLKGGIVALILWWIFLFIGALFVINRTHWLTLALFVLMTVIEFFDPTQVIIGGIGGIILFFAFLATELYINKRNVMTSFAIAMVLSWSLLMPSPWMNVALIVIMLIHKQFTPIHFKEDKK